METLSPRDSYLLDFEASPNHPLKKGIPGWGSKTRERERKKDSSGKQTLELGNLKS